MNIFKLIIRSLIFYKKQQLAVLAGTILSTAVLTGALIIGDSVNGSLKQMVDLRLGKAKYALVTGDRFVRSKLAIELANDLKIDASPLLAVEGITINTENNIRLNKTKVYGIENSFWQFSDSEEIKLADDEVLISQNIAERLNLKEGNELLLRIENAEVIPLNAPFASQENNSVSLRMTVKAILNENQLSRFSIRSDQKAPYNVFLSRDVLAEKLDLKDLSNLIILSKKDNQSIDVEAINKSISNLWQLDDISLKIKPLNEKGTYELVSDRIFIEDQVTNAIKELNVQNKPVLTYLVNEIQNKGKSTPYSFVSATDQLFTNENLAENEILINSWLAEDISAKIGDTLNLKYYIIGPLRKLQEESAKFVVKDVVPIENRDDLKSLMPSFPGLSDAGYCREWETGVPIDLDKIRDKDEDYWNTYKGTPKGYISINSGQKIWQNQFGKLTALRFDSTLISPSSLKKKLIAKLKPSDFNLTVQAVYEQGIAATVNAVDFGELFLSLSFFVIVAGVLLTVLLHTLNTESRSSETGIFAGLGFSKKMILKIRLGESLIVAVLGGILGAFIGILYNYAMLIGLNSVWYDVVRTSMISVFIKPATLFIGAFSGFLISLLSIYFVSRKKLKHPAAFLIKNISTSSTTKSKTGLSKLIAIISFLIVLLALIYSFSTSVDNNAGLFLSAGGLVLVGCVALFHWYLKKPEKNDNSLTINKLSIKNSSRNTSRSLTTIVLLALGTFVILITGANRKTFYGEEKRNGSGTGGYLFWAETSLPIIENLNSEHGKAKLGIENTDLPSGTHFMQFHNLEGNDASCLNLNQVQQPQILGVNAAEFNDRNSFSFASLLDGIDRDQTWMSLNKTFGENVIPSIIDQTVLVWGLKKTVGDTLVYLNEKGEQVKLLIIGGLNNSIFQGNVLIADQFFTKQFPSVSGSKIMLIDADSESEAQIKEYLSNQLVDYGIDVQKATDRLNEFNSVTNTYLAVFMILGGLGVLIGTIGLGIVLLRNMIERKPELALMTALGFTKKQLLQLIFKENLFLLLSGIGVGILAAIIGILPSILSPSFEIPGTFVFILIVIVLFSGFLWIYFPAKMALKSVPIKALRRE